MVAPAVPVQGSIWSVVGGYVALTKPRIIELLLVTTVPVMVVANGGVPGVWLMVATVIGGTLSAGGANAINMYVDRDIDAQMERTRNRPLVTGVMQPTSALVFAILLELFAVLWLWYFVNLLSAALALAACLFYVFVYTLWLKRITTQNIVIGGAAGAAPVLIGWAAVTNSLSLSAWVLFALMFFWTPPHFWALAIRYKDDYGKAGVPMLPTVKTLDETTRQMLIYSVVVVICSVAFAVTAEMGILYWVGAVLLGFFFLAMTVKVQHTKSTADAIRLFTYSITYVTLLFALMAVDVIVRNGW